MSPDTKKEDGGTSPPNERDRTSPREHIAQAQSTEDHENKEHPPSSPAGKRQTPALRTQDLENARGPSVPDIGSSWSTSSDKQLGSPSSVADRVFPIRSVISVDPTQTPGVMAGRRSGEQSDYFHSSAPSPAGSRGEAATPGKPRAQSNVSFREATHAQAPRQSKQQDERQVLGRKERNSSSTSTNASTYDAANRLQLFRDDESSNSYDKNDTASKASGASGLTGTSRDSGASDTGSLTGLVTARFKHVVTSDGHAVITGRDGDTLQRCEDEPIHIPGAVQSFGLLVALEEKEDGQLLVRVVSENSHRIIGYHPQELFKLNNFCDILSEEQQDNLLDHVDFIRDEEADPASNGPEVFTLSIRPPKSNKRSRKLWCAMHINPTQPDIIICEFELDDDQVNPLVPANDATPEGPEDTLDSNPTEEELAESTTAMSKPLRVLRSARKRKGEAAAMEVFNIMSQVQEQLASAPNLDQFLKILVGVVKELTGFHRVMIYQFDAAFNGRVVTELVDPRATKDLFKGLNFPASDIPKQARDLYKVNKVRLLYDRDLETARLVCRSVEDLETPLDLSFSYLRAMSPIHIKYLANMAVRSSMSISINAFNELWGLIACHTYGSKGMRVSFPIRKMCRLVGDTASRNIERLSYASRLQARKLINTVPTDANPSGYIIASSEDLLKLFDADFGLLSIHDETKILGKLEQSQEALAMLEYLRLRKINSVITSQDIKQDFPDLVYPPGFKIIAGLLLVPLSVGGTDFITFFRSGVTREVKWAGNPYEKFVKEGTEGYLEPRKSFKTWREVVVGKCRDWTEEQVETAAVLCLVYGKFIEVWRQKEAALQSSQFTKLLLANSAHEVRTPLNAIINYLEIAMEGTLDQDTRDNLAKSHSASKSLIYVINDLLDLTKTEEGQNLIQDEIFDLPATIHEATSSFKGDAKRKGLSLEVVEHPGIPQLVHGDQRRVRQVVSNLTANAVQHTATGWVHIEMYLQEIVDNRATVEIVVEDSGVGMSDEKLDALFRDLEQVTTDEKKLDTTDGSPSGSTVSKESRTLGLGLAMVGRIIHTMDGQLRLKSVEGQGSRFVIQLPFVLPHDYDSNQTGEQVSATNQATSSNQSFASYTRETQGEMILVDKVSSVKSGGVMSRRESIEELSLRSYKSGSSNKSNQSARSDVDRLIDAISTPFQIGEVEHEGTRLQRANSKGSGTSRHSGGSLPVPQSNRISMSGPERASALQRSKSLVPQEHLRSPQEGSPGSEFIQDNRALLRAVRMPDEFNDNEFQNSHTRTTSKVSFDEPETMELAAPPAPPKPLDAEHLQVLVAEDDPVNSRIITKRLEKSGHQIYLTINGEECASAYGEKPAFFDVVLMDMQMPIVDGLSSTKMIRSYEKSHPPTTTLSPRATLNGRVPIFAVSASLLERERNTYIAAGFDGWILKPIDFKRLAVLLSGIVSDDARRECLYAPGHWERGGWFTVRQPSVLEVDTTPSGKSPVQNPPQGLEKRLPDERSVASESTDSGSMTPVNDGRRPFVYDMRLDAVDVGKTSNSAVKDLRVDDVTDA